MTVAPGRSAQPLASIGRRPSRNHAMSGSPAGLASHAILVGSFGAGLAAGGRLLRRAGAGGGAVGGGGGRLDRAPGSNRRLRLRRDHVRAGRRPARAEQRGHPLLDDDGADARRRRRRRAGAPAVAALPAAGDAGGRVRVEGHGTHEPHRGGSGADTPRTGFAAIGWCGAPRRGERPRRAAGAGSTGPAAGRQPSAPCAGSAAVAGLDRVGIDREPDPLGRRAAARPRSRAGR